MMQVDGINNNGITFSRTPEQRLFEQWWQENRQEYGYLSYRAAVKIYEARNLPKQVDCSFCIGPRSGGGDCHNNCPQK